MRRQETTLSTAFSYAGMESLAFAAMGSFSFPAMGSFAFAAMEFSASAFAFAAMGSESFITQTPKKQSGEIPFQAALRPSISIPG
jgi:hypothetical protein